LLTTCSNYTKRVETGDLNPNGLMDAIQAADNLGNIRAKVKYPLWGIDLGLQTLLDIPKWLKDWGVDSTAQKRLLMEASNLRHLIDEIIRRSYHNGHPPTKWQMLKIKSLSKRLIQNWGNSKK
jgi:hypothetical protein